MEGPNYRTTSRAVFWEPFFGQLVQYVHKHVLGLVLTLDALPSLPWLLEGQITLGGKQTLEGWA